MITVTEKAAENIREIMKNEDKEPEKVHLRIFVQGGGCSGFQYGLMIDENGKNAADQEFESTGIRLLVDPISIRYVDGAEIYFNETHNGIAIKNPNATSTCGCGQSFNNDDPPKDDCH